MNQDLSSNFVFQLARDQLIEQEKRLFLGAITNSTEKSAGTSADNVSLAIIPKNGNLAHINHDRYYIHNPHLGVSLNAAQAIEEENSYGSVGENESKKSYHDYPSSLAEVKKFKDHKSILALINTFNNMVPELQDEENQAILLEQIIDTINKNDSLNEVIDSPSFKKVKDFIDSETELLEKLSNGSGLRQAKFYERLESVFKRAANQSYSLNSLLKKEVLEKTNSFTYNLFKFGQLPQNEANTLREDVNTKAKDFIIKVLNSTSRIKNTEEQNYLIENEIATLKDFNQFIENNPEFKDTLTTHYQKYLINLFDHKQVSVENKEKLLKQLQILSPFKDKFEFIYNAQNAIYNSHTRLMPSLRRYGYPPGLADLLSLKLPDQVSNQAIDKKFDNAVYIQNKNPSFYNSGELLKSFYKLSSAEQDERRNELLSLLKTFPQFHDNKVIELNKSQNQYTSSIIKENAFIQAEKENILRPILENRDFEIFNLRIKNLIEETKPNDSLLLNEIAQIIIDSLQTFAALNPSYTSPSLLKDYRISKSLSLLQEIYKKEDLSNSDENTANKIMSNESGSNNDDQEEPPNIAKLINIKTTLSEDSEKSFNNFIDTYLSHLEKIFSQRNGKINKKHHLLIQANEYLSEKEIKSEDQIYSFNKNAYQNIANSINIPEAKTKYSDNNYTLNELHRLEELFDIGYGNSVTSSFHDNTIKVPGNSLSWIQFFKKIIQLNIKNNDKEINQSLIKLSNKFLNSLMHLSKYSETEFEDTLETIEEILKLNNIQLKQKAESSFIGFINEKSGSTLAKLSILINSYNKLINSDNNSLKDSASFFTVNLQKQITRTLSMLQEKLEKPQTKINKVGLKELNELAKSLKKNFEKESLKLDKMIRHNISNTRHQDEDKNAIMHQIEERINSSMEYK